MNYSDWNNGMFPTHLDLKVIEEMRRKLGLTQHQLAKLSGVSQSLIAKIEKGKINPSFEAVKRIFVALEKVRAEKMREIRAKDICTRNVIYVSIEDDILKAVEIMRKYDISQLPVFEGKTPVGSISESTITKKLDKIRSFKIKVKEIMDEGFPVTPEDTSVSLLREILMEYPAVLLQKNGVVTGIITKADILKVLEFKLVKNKS